MPERIRLRRTRGWRKPEGAIVVARPSKFGNPFVVGDEIQVTAPSGDIAMIPMTPEMAVSCYLDLMRSRLHLLGATHPDDVAYVEQWRADVRSLRGHDLACWCPLNKPCHADVLLAIANATWGDRVD